MVLNELMTNSMKHGALGADGGCVRVGWETTAGSDGGRLVEIKWSEAGGPPIGEEPVPRVGTSLVEGLVVSELRGRAELTYPRDGARHTLYVTFEDEPPIAAPVASAGT